MKKKELVHEVRSLGPHLQHLIDNRHLSTRCLFSNGNIEFFLKSILFDHIDLNLKDSQHAFCMDKRINNHQIDVIGFYNRRIGYTVETKCTLADDLGGSSRAAGKAMEQALRNARNCRHMDYVYQETVHHYIIHFLMLESGRDNRLFPQPIQDKFPVKRRNGETQEGLSRLYGRLDQQCEKIVVIEDRLIAFVAEAQNAE